MGRYKFGQKVVIKETGEIKQVWYATPIIKNSWFMMDDTMYHENQFFAPSEPWKQNANVADVLPSAARAANRAIERMINQSPPI